MPTASDPTADNDPPSPHTGSGLVAEKARRLAQLDEMAHLNETIYATGGLR